MHDVVIPIVAMMIPMIIVPTVLGLRHARYLREVEHVERTRAMELGRALPGEEQESTPGQIILWIGAYVPIGALGVAFVASQSLGFHQEIWVTSGLVGLAGVVGGTFLASRQLIGRDAAESVISKPVHDPDAFDVVGRRG